MESLYGMATSSTHSLNPSIYITVVSTPISFVMLKDNTTVSLKDWFGSTRNGGSTILITSLANNSEILISEIDNCDLEPNGRRKQKINAAIPFLYILIGPAQTPHRSYNGDGFYT